MADDYRLKKRAAGPEFESTDELVVWAHDDGTLRTTDEDGTVAEVGGGSQPVWLMNGIISPQDVVTPSQQGAVYVDTAKGSIYVATGPTDADWILIGGPNEEGSQFSGIPGVYFDTTAAGLYVVGDLTALVSDKGAMAVGATENGWYWNPNTAADGAQNAALQVGPSGAFFHSWTPDGVYHVANGVIFPSADPHVAGAWWDNAGTLTKSAG